MKLPKLLTTVTPFSKALAMFLFIIFPIIGFYLGMQYSHRLNAPSLPTPTPSFNIQRNIIKISEIGIQIPATSDIVDLDYVIKNGTDQTANDKLAFLSTKSLEEVGGQGCSAAGGALGIISVLSIPPSVAGNGGMSSVGGTFIKQIGDKYLYYRGPQAFCSDNRDASLIQTKALAAIRSQLQQATSAK